ncbi:MAG TPA: hypothetical protein VFA70_15430 [Dehalococcoidia bacterium]|nr:hypothetical protein [Dehalococcoidia bacterium]
MENPLTQVYFLERCNVCGETYPLNLYGIYRRQHLDAEWQSARPCADCDARQERLVAAVPAQELAELAAAWDRLAASLDASGLAYHVGDPKDVASSKASHPAHAG